MISESYKSKKKISEWSSAPILSLSLFIDYYFFHLSIKIRNEFTKKHQFNIFFKTFFFQFHNFVQFYYWWQNSLVVMRPDIISADGALTSERKMVNGRLVNKREIIEENILWKFIISTDVLADVYFWHHDDPLSPTRRKNSGLTRCQRITWFEVDC